MLRELNTSFLSKFKHDMENGYQTLDNPIDIVLNTLLDIGFSSCRYWMLCIDEIEDASYFVLAKAAGDQKFEKKYGYTIPITQCSMFEKMPESNDSITIGNVRVFEHTRSYISGKAKTAKINRDLKLDDDFYIHFPILCHGDVHGQISCSYNSDSSLQTQDLVNGLQIIGMMLGDYKLLYSQRKLEKAKEQFANEESALVYQRDNRKVLNKISSIILDLVDSEFASAFDFNWYEGKLVKVAEAPQNNGTNQEEILPESYGIGEYLTGLAYKHKRYRYIFDVSRLKEREPNVVKDEVVQYLREEADSPSEVQGCIAYGLIGKREHHSLIRIFNKAGDQRIPFDRFDLNALEAACDHFSKAYDDITSYSQLERLQKFSNQITDQFFKMDNVCEIAHRYLTDEWISEIIVFGSLDSENYATIYKQRSVKSNNYAKHEQKLTPFVKQILEADDIGWISLNPIKNSREERVEKYMTESGYSGILVVPNDFGNFQGGMGIPLKHQPDLRNHTIPELHAANIKAYSSILCKLMSFMRNLLALGQARDFVGTIGHELKKPIADIYRQKIKLKEAIDDLLSSHPEVATHQFVQQYLENYQLKEKVIPFEEYVQKSIGRLGQLIRTTDILVDTASTIAQISNNIIELTYQPINIYELVSNIAKDVRGEVDLLQGPRNLNVVFSFNESFKRLTPLVCDKYIIEKIIENIFRNALKYSIPPGRGQPIKIDVVANPQPGQFLNIQVTNWGMPVPEDRREEIFLPFIRGAVRDEVRAKRGMGIGLYIARMFAEAHKGTVSIIDSVPGFDDHRRKDKEGWSTTFEIRLADKLKPGTYQFDIEKHKLLAP